MREQVLHLISRAKLVVVKSVGGGELGRGSGVLTSGRLLLSDWSVIHEQR
jgi:hypothetical protein